MIKRRPLRFVYMCGVLAVLFVQPSLLAYARSLEEIKKTGEIRICIVPDSPAYAVAKDPECRENCTFSGPVIKEVMAFVNSLGDDIRPVFHRIEWDEQFHNSEGKTERETSYTPVLLDSGKCDIYPSHLTRNEWRLKKLDFAILFSSRMMVIVNKSKKKLFRTVSDLAGKITATEINSSHHTWLLNQNLETFSRNPIVVQSMPTEQGLESLESGHIDFMLVDSDVALWAIANYLKNCLVAFPVGSMDEIGWAFRKQDQDLKQAAQDFFDTQLPDETSILNRIWKEDFGISLIQLKTLIHATQ